MPHKVDLAIASMERLAEQKGDITAEVLDLYYARFPDARDSFEYHGCGNTAELEGRMVNTAAFYLLEWAENASGVFIQQGTTIPHHHDTLLVGPQWYMGLIDAVLVVLLETIPAECSDEREMWLKIRSEIATMIEGFRPEFWREDKDGPLPEFDPDRANWVPNLEAVTGS